MDKIFATIPEGKQALGVGRSTVYEIIGRGEIETVTIGRRRLLVVESMKKYADRLRALAAA